MIISLDIPMTEEELIENIVDTGADSCPWWVSVKYIPGIKRVELITIDPEEQDAKPETFLYEVSDLIDALNQACNAHPWVLEYFMINDVDAEAADMVLQTMAFGEVVYG